ncbi:MAG: PKD domain-containing protein, partial [Candidatus Thermoplasmatota archaeon]|nr:PKD domain-containing protein [Candidatus Thermoplasmatota archaeon]
VKVNISFPNSTIKNMSMNYISGSNTYYYTANYDVYGDYTYFIWAIDSFNNSNVSSVYQFSVSLQPEPPVVSSITAFPNTQEISECVNISCNATDNVEVGKVKTIIKDPGGSTMGNFTMQGYNLNERKNGIYYYYFFPHELGIYSYHIWACDINLNQNSSSTYTFCVEDTVPPEIKNVSAHPALQDVNGSINISCMITDNHEVDSVGINIFCPNGSVLNNAMNGNGEIFFLNCSFSQNGVYNYSIRAEDKSNNSNLSASYSFKITFFPIANFSYTPLNPTDLDTITFDASNSYDPDGSIVNYTWSFGDGSVAYETVVNHKYSSDGNYDVTLTVYDNDGAWDCMEIELLVANVPPIANFSFSPSNATVGQTIQFNDGSHDPDGNIYIWQWDFGDGTWINGTYEKANPIHAYARDGIFNITLTVTDDDYAKSNITKQIHIRDICPPDIKNLSANPNPQEIYGNVNITCKIEDDVSVATAVINVTGIDHNNSGVKFNESMNHASGTSIWYYDVPYNKEGNYSYFVWSDDPSGNVNITSIHTFKIIIPAEPPRITNVQSTPAEQQYGSRVNISCNVTDNVEVEEVRINVTYTNGTTGNFTMHGYNTDGKGNGAYYYNNTYLSLGNYTYFVWSRDINDYGNTSEIKNFSIVDTTPPEIRNVSVNPSIQKPGNNINISCIIIDNMEVDRVYMEIKYPNGTILEFAMQNWGMYYLNKTYDGLGTYNWTIHANDTAGNKNLYENAFIITFFPDANFSYTPPSPTDLDTIQFIDNSSDVDGILVNWTWDFGDGNISYEQNPLYQYADDGTYTVVLTVKDDDGATNIISKEVIARNIFPTVGFEYTPSSPTDLDVVTFNASGSSDPDGHIVNYTWSFGDGNMGYGCNVSYQYIFNGNYTINLTIMDNDGAISFTEKNITILNVPPVVNFSYEINGFTVYFTDLSSDGDGSIVNYTWSFGDGNISYDKNTTNFYSHEGVYSVSLTVVDDDGGTAIRYEMVSLGLSLIANFSYTPESPISDEQINFIDNSSNAERWQWNFGDNCTSDKQNPLHIYPIGNYYNVTLTIFNGSKNASISKILGVGTKIQIFRNENNVVNYIPWLGNETKASDLASLIGNDIMPTGSVVSRWNVSIGAFDSYVVGISPPSYDFVIHPYDSIVVRVAQSGPFVEYAFKLIDRVVYLFKSERNVVNNVVWSCINETKASDLASLIGNDIMPTGSVVSRWNVSIGAFDSYVVGISPPSYDFVIEPGDCVVLRVSSSGEFSIGVKK